MSTGFGLCGGHRDPVADRTGTASSTLLGPITEFVEWSGSEAREGEVATQTSRKHRAETTTYVAHNVMLRFA